ncbi:MAG: hypothetical protein ACR2JP_10100 [Acidimicrobiia bacterium]
MAKLTKVFQTRGIAALQETLARSALADIDTTAFVRFGAVADQAASMTKAYEAISASVLNTIDTSAITRMQETLEL